MRCRAILAVIVSAAGIALCLLLAVVFVNISSAIMLAVFSSLFVILTYHLDGNGIHKAGLLLLGNFVFLFWNYLFFLFSYFGTQHFGEFFGVACTVFAPFLNVLWIVSFWSLSLTALRKAVVDVDSHSS